MKLGKYLLSGLTSLLLTGNLWAGAENFRATTEVRAPVDRRFEAGHFEFSVMSGALFSSALNNTSVFPRSRTNFDYTQTEIRTGLMLHSPWEAGILSGNFEVLVGLGGGAVFDGPGTGLANGDILFRYNFVQPRAFVVPYWQLGLGLAASDASRDHTQRLIGRTVEFTLQSSVGLRFLLNDHWSIDVEAIYQHISNADTADRNVGVNAVGGLLGATYSL